VLPTGLPSRFDLYCSGPYRYFSPSSVTVSPLIAYCIQSPFPPPANGLHVFLNITFLQYCSFVHFLPDATSVSPLPLPFSPVLGACVCRGFFLRTRVLFTSAYPVPFFFRHPNRTFLIFSSDYFISEKLFFCLVGITAH